MGNQTSLTYNKMPNAILTFGPASESTTNLEGTRTVLNELDRMIEKVNNVVDIGSSIELLEQIGKFSEPAGTIITILLKLIGETDDLQKEITKVETKIHTIDIEGSLRILKNIVEILNYPKIEDNQKLIHVSLAIHAIAIKMPGYDNPGLKDLTIDYQVVLDSFRKRCIRERCRSIYLYTTAGLGLAAEGAGDDPRTFYYEGLKEFPKYFGNKDINTSKNPSRESTEQEQLTFCEKRWTFFGNNIDEIQDEWDNRKGDKITFHSVDLHRDENGFGTFSQSSLYNKAIHTYRQKVVDLMEGYFGSANVSVGTIADETRNEAEERMFMRD